MNRRHADFQAPSLSSEISALSENSYQDKPLPNGEHDKREPLPKLGYFDREKPARTFGSAASRASQNRIRLSRARDLALAIRKAHPDDARAILTAALIDLMAGMPPHAVFGSIREEARWWAQNAAPLELFEVMSAALENLRNKPLHKDMRKRLLWSMWQSLDGESQTAFLAKIGGAE